MKYEIYEPNLKNLVQKLMRLNIKLDRIGAELIHYVVTGYQDKPSEQDPVKLIRFIEVQIDSDVPRCNGWQFIATLVHTDEGNIVRSIPGYKVPADYRDKAPNCDHCKMLRQRRDTYVLRHEDGRTVQVGSSCLQEFLGTAPEKLAKIAELILSAYSVCEAAQKQEWLGGTNTINVYRIDLDTYLQNVAAVVLKEGRYVTRKMAREQQNGLSTSDKAQQLMAGAFTVDLYGHTLYPITLDAVKLATDARDWVLSTYQNSFGDPAGMADEDVMGMIMNTLKGVNKEISDFEHNLLACARAEVIEPRLCGIASYIVEAFCKSQPKANVMHLDCAGLPRIFEMFNKANVALKRPAIRLATENGHYLIMSLAGSTSRNPGSIYVKGERGTDAYFGKITPDGKFFPVVACPSSVEGQLRAFAADPEWVASKYGKLTGHCCFCGRNLTDKRSTQVGYGEVCAEKFGLSYPVHSELAITAVLV